MAIFRVKKTEDYTVMSNYHLRDRNLTLKAKGLLSWMLSNTEDWDYTVAGIVAVMKESRDAINSALTELEDYGYLTREQSREAGKFGDIEYIIREKPITENPLSVNPTTENPKQTNTNKTNTNKTNTKKSLSNDKEAKASYKDIYNAEENKFIRDALVKFVNSCKGKNYNPRVTSVAKWADTLREYCGSDSSLAMKTVDHCISEGWKAIYPLKGYMPIKETEKLNEDNLVRNEDGSLVTY